MKSSTGKLLGIVNGVYDGESEMHTAFCLEDCASILHTDSGPAAPAVARFQDRIVLA